MQLTVEALQRWIINTNEKMQENKGYLSELDQAIGDGDHGHNMARGFQEVVNKIEGNSFEEAGSLFKQVAMTLISKVGGAAGPLYGTAFLKASDEWKEKTTIDQEALGKGMEAAIAGIKTRGKAQEGDKTMLDVWGPIHAYVTTQPLQREKLKKTAKEAMEKTKEMTAKKGRAAYFGERSAEHVDPGAYSSYLVFEALAESITNEGDANG
ncbi:dihydroxyacetone kinase subunit DhaL [Alteribacillus bidgolensis]|uniref:phosphoenolpyruvate--glycerone phosphotransferase n=1 Tax=Alteribacillus bidgolensis TaxID=930129 RepID=A0A1G8LYV2_9BACI|nr:dihydroxyacetone kinase subunit DhaL [Alteribacillus bidgolensis]SDI60793.1 dihydroxyacetone kinase DhaL subunit [Alteribacillus bidgolensis]